MQRRVTRRLAPRDSELTPGGGVPTYRHDPGRSRPRRSLARTTNATYCPYKGAAAYYSLKVDGRISENAVWTYEAPYPAMAQIKDHLAFYPSRVDRIEETQ